MVSIAGAGERPPSEHSTARAEPYRLPLPPAYEYAPPPMLPRAPHYSIWVGVRPALVAYGGAFSRDQEDRLETTGNFVNTGGGLQIDIGARVWTGQVVPFLFGEYHWLGVGRRFEGMADASAYDRVLGGGFRGVFGDIDRGGLILEYSIGHRVVGINQSNDKGKLSGFEFLRFGLGAEIRFTDLFTLSPLVSFIAASMNQQEGQSIQSAPYYYVLSVACGAHFDLFGK
ncbi:hypothetical protein [Pajaroellobacter abortibovis]|nr:hypothetical protein [Pajaroellobacter abortibovis]